MELLALAKELERQRESRMDVIVPSTEIFAQPTVDDVDLNFTVPSEGGSQMQVMPLTDWAHSQVAGKLDIPLKYYRRMREQAPELLARNINTWMPTPNKELISNPKDRKLLLRTLDGSVRAVLSDRYKILDNHDLLLKSLEEFREVGAELHRADLTPNHMYIKATVPHTVAEIQKGDTVVPGVIIQNSEVGAGAFKVMPFMLRQICSNGMIGESKITKIHLGRKQDQGIIQFSAETQMAENATLWLQVRDIIRGTFDPVTFQRWASQLRMGTEVEIENPVYAVDNVIETFGINEEMKDELLNHFSREGDMTQWGLANAVTRTARDMEDPEKVIEMEVIGGQVAVMPQMKLLPATV